MDVYAIATYDLHIPEKQFRRSLTLRQFVARYERLTLAEQRIDYRFGLLTAVCANPWRDPKQHADGFEPRDFYPNLPKPPEPEDTDPYLLADMLRAWAQQMNGTPEQAN